MIRVEEKEKDDNPEEIYDLGVENMKRRCINIIFGMVEPYQRGQDMGLYIAELEYLVDNGLDLGFRMDVDSPWNSDLVRDAEILGVVSVPNVEGLIPIVYPPKTINIEIHTKTIKSGMVIKFQYNYNPLSMAFSYAILPLIEFLISNGAVKNDGSSIYTYLNVNDPRSIDIFELIHDIMPEQNEGEIFIELTTEYNYTNTTFINYIIDNLLGDDIDQDIMEGKTFLQFAMEENNYGVVKILLEKGADLKKVMVEAIIDEIYNDDILKILYDKGYKLPIKKFYLNQNLPIDRYQSLRPIFQPTFYNPQSICQPGEYLPIYRIDELYYKKNEILTDLPQGPGESCGTFYFYEPESPFYLHLGKYFIAATKVDAYMKLSGEPNYDFMPLHLKNVFNNIFTIDNLNDIYRTTLYNVYHAEHKIIQILNDDTNALYYKSDGKNLSSTLFFYDNLDHDICQMAQKQGFDTIIIQHEPGEKRSNTEILDTRPRPISYSSICKLDIKEKENQKDRKYPTVWFPDNGTLVIKE